MEHFFSPNSGEDQKKRSSPELEHFFQVFTCAQMQTKVKLLEGMQMKTILKLLWVYSQILGGYIPPCFGTTTLDALQHVIFGLLCLFRKSFHLNRLMLAHFYVNILKHSETIFTISEECE